MNKTAKIDFFTVEIADSKDLETILRDLHQTPVESRKRNIEIDDDWIRLARGKLSDDGYLGDIMRISMAPAGFRADLTGRITAVDMGQEEGFAECAAFYFDFNHNILVLQRNSRAVTSGQLSRYFKRVANLDGEVEIKPVIRPTDIMKVKVLPVIRKIHISSSVVDAMTTMENIDANTRQLILNAAQAESPGIEIVMKASREKGASLNQAVAHEAIESWLKIQADLSDEENDVVKKIVVTGKDESGTTAEFDLLRDRMFTVMNYQLVPDDAALWKTRSDHIQQAWELNHAQIERLLATNEIE